MLPAQSTTENMEEGYMERDEPSKGTKMNPKHGDRARVHHSPPFSSSSSPPQILCTYLDLIGHSTTNDCVKCLDSQLILARCTGAVHESKNSCCRRALQSARREKRERRKSVRNQKGHLTEQISKDSNTFPPLLTFHGCDFQMPS